MSSAAEFFFRTDRQVLERVGKTASLTQLCSEISKLKSRTVVLASVQDSRDGAAMEVVLEGGFSKLQASCDELRTHPLQVLVVHTVSACSHASTIDKCPSCRRLGRQGPWSCR
jgi:hypothetical protein